MTDDLVPRHGDRVRARLATRAREEVEGALHLRGRARETLRVDVLLDTGALRSVDPSTVRVVERNGRAGAPPPLDVRTLPPERGRAGGTWGQLETRLATALTPLATAGWAVEPGPRQESWEFGDSVTSFLSRDGRQCSAELYDDDALALWGEADEADDHGEADVQWSDGALPPAALAAWYAELGLLP